VQHAAPSLYNTIQYGIVLFMSEFGTDPWSQNRAWFIEASTGPQRQQVRQARDFLTMLRDAWTPDLSPIGEGEVAGRLKEGLAIVDSLMVPTALLRGAQARLTAAEEQAAAIHLSDFESQQRAWVPDPSPPSSTPNS
jgi:hypothetical protein